MRLLQNPFMLFFLKSHEATGDTRQTKDNNIKTKLTLNKQMGCFVVVSFSESY